MTTCFRPRMLSCALACSLLAGSALAQNAPDAGQTPAPAPLVDESALELKNVDAFHGAGILIFQTPDGEFKWWLDGRINLDAAMYRSELDNPLANGAEIRRARFALNMQLWKDWASQFDIEYIQDNSIEIKDMWIGYAGVPNSILKVGNFKEPFGLESLTSSRYITFIERALIDNFSPDRRLGIAWAQYNHRYYLSGGVFGQAVGDTDTTGQDQGYSLTGRVTGLPLLTDTALVHVGVAASYLTPDAATATDLSDADQMRLRARPETHVNRGRFIDTKKISNVDHQNLVGVEAAAEYRSVSVQGEYNWTRFDRNINAPEPTFDGWYTFVSWFPTGEHRPYNYTFGEFDRVMPRSRRGALELAVRFSTADLNDTSLGIFGGKEDITTVGANWYANPNIRVMVDYAWVVNDQYTKGDRGYKVNDRINTLQARLQLMF